MKKTKNVELFVDLCDSWQDFGFDPCFLNAMSSPPMQGYKRYKVIVPLPCMVTDTIIAKIEEV